MRIFNLEITRRSVRDEYMKTAKDNFVSRWARPPSLNTAQWLDMFSKSPRLAVVDRIASDLATISGKLLKVEEDGTETEITSHRFLDFMEQPNPLYEMTSSAIWRLHEIYLMLVGESFFLIERDERNRPVELWNVPPHWVKMTPYLGSPTYTIVSPGGLTMQVPVDDMFVMKQLNPLDPFLRGLGIAESIADEVEIDEYAAKFQKRFFYNDATPPVVFLMPDATDDQRDAFLARWNQKHRGVENSHRAAAFSGRVDVKELGSSNGKNLSFVESRIAIRDAVLEHFGVPREIMGITENSNRATADAAQYIYAKNVLAPRIKMREEAINKQLLPLFGDGLIWRFDPVIPYDKEFDKAKALDGWNSGLLMQNEARRLLDMPDIEGGNVFKVSINDLFLNETDSMADVSQSMLQDDLALQQSWGWGEKKRARVNPEALVRREAEAERADVRLFEAAVTKHFRDQIDAVSEALGLTSKAVADDVFEALSRFLTDDGMFDPDLWDALPEDEQRRITEAIADGLLDWNAEAEKLIQLFNPIWRKTYSDGVKISEEIYNLTEVDRPEFVTHAKVNGGQRIVGIEQATKRKIAEIISRGVAEGSSQATLRQYIKDEMNFASAARVKTIARQETMTTLATGQFDMMKSAGAKTKTWHHRPQKNPRDGSNGPNHVILNGETVPIDGRFSNGLRYPRDPQDPRPEELINCRCYLTYGGF
jgi:HK97 family phage portal protein